jgi:hypothetical protein
MEGSDTDEFTASFFGDIADAGKCVGDPIADGATVSC